MRRFIRQNPELVSIDTKNNVKSYTSPKVKEKLRKELLVQTQNHCSFCDLMFDYKILAGFKPEIEHFKPKNKFPHLEKDWSNLFISCRLCNESKGNNYDDLHDIYKPDIDDYQFQKYFEIDIETFDIKPCKAGKTETEISRAQLFIDWLGVNDTERRKARARFFKDIKSRSSEVFYLDDLSYRFVFEYFNTIIEDYFPNIR